MGWNVPDYPSPPEPRGFPQRWCNNGCEISSTSETYECQAKACSQTQLCEGCVYVCSDCGDDFCLAHVRDLKPPSSPDTLYVCQSCLAKITTGEITTFARAGEAAE